MAPFTAGGAYTELAKKANLASPAFTGTPTAPTQAAGNNSTRLATTAFVQTSASETLALALLESVNQLAVDWAFKRGDEIGKMGAVLNTLAVMGGGASNATLAGMSTMAAVAASSTAMSAIIASSIAMSAIIASSTAMTAVAASSTAMTAVAASSTAMTAVYNSSIARARIEASSTAIASLNDKAGVQTLSLPSPGTSTFNGPAFLVSKNMINYANNSSNITTFADGTANTVHDTSVTTLNRFISKQTLTLVVATSRTLTMEVYKW